MKYTIKLHWPLYIDVEVEAKTIEQARQKALTIGNKTPIGDWEQYNEVEVYETEWEESDGLRVVI